MKKTLSVAGVFIIIAGMASAGYHMIQNPLYTGNSENALETSLSSEEIGGIYSEKISEESSDLKEISWVLNDDGTYTFTNNVGEKDSIYAWYVLGKSDEVIFKTKYSDSKDFVYDLKDNYSLVIKGFVRTGTDADYEQTSYRLPASEILGLKKYTVNNISIPKNIDKLLFDALPLFGEATLAAEDVRKGDGSAWEVDLTLPVDWTCPNITSRSYGVRVNGFWFLDEIFKEYFLENKESDGKLILSYMIDWAEQNPVYSESSEWIWHDDATARRVAKWCICYHFLENLCSDQEKATIEASLSYQAQLLASDDFYTKRHNHGMFQDMALILYSILFENNSELQKQYIEKALSRTGDYLDYVYASDGVHKEHSPYYARDVLANTLFLERLVHDISPEFSEYIQQYITGGQEYLIQLIKPDGSWPSLGDSSRNPNAVSQIKDIMDDNIEFQYIESTGEDGSCPALDKVFPDGGYAIFRSSWSDSANEGTWMLFNAATHSSTHKHGDDLEVLLYHKGDLFVEAGKRNYNYSDEMTAWSYSGYGHNVLLIDGESYPVKIGANGFQSIYPDALKTGITDYEIGESISSVTGFECRFEDIEQTRELTYNRTENTVIIDDTLEASKAYDGTLLWHIAEGVDVVETSSGWDFFRNNELVASMTVFSDTEFHLETIRNQEGEYPYISWIFNGYDTPSFGSLLKINFAGNSGKTEIAALIQLY